MKKVLFVCVHNAGRSQMAESFFNEMANGNARAFSAGTKPTEKVTLVVAEVMREAGIDISRRKPKLLTAEMLEYVDLVINMGCGVEGTCPANFVPDKDWHIEGPAGKPIEQARIIREQIKAKVEELIKELERTEVLPNFNMTLNQP